MDRKLSRLIIDARLISSISLERKRFELPEDGILSKISGMNSSCTQYLIKLFGVARYIKLYLIAEKLEEIEITRKKVGIDKDAIPELLSPKSR